MVKTCGEPIIKNQSKTQSIDFSFCRLRICKNMRHENWPFKVEKILNISLDSIPSLLVKIQIMGQKVWLRYHVENI